MTRLLPGALLGLLLAGPALADDAADCRNRDALSDKQRLPLCTSAIEAATDPRDRADLLLWRAAILDRAGADEAALADFATAAELAPDWADPLVDRAWFHVVRGNMDAMVADLEEALRLEPRSIYALQEAMNLLPDAGQWRRCLDISDDATEVAGDDPVTFAYRGRCKLDAGDPAGALADFQEARRMGLDEAYLRSNMAVALLDLDRSPKALAEAQAAVALDPAHAHSRLSLVRSLVATGDLDGALAAAREGDALLSLADRRDIDNDAAWGLYLDGRHAEGLPLVEGWLTEQGAQLSTEEAAIVDTYAHLLAAAGQPERSAEAFLKAVELEPSRRAGYATRLGQLGFGADVTETALRACAATGAACRLSN